MRISQSILVLVLCVGPLLMDTSAQADSFRAGIGAGNQDYKSIFGAGNFSLSSDSSLNVSAESSGPKGQKINEGRIGYDRVVSERIEWELNLEFRSEPLDVQVLGLEPEVHLNFENLLLPERSTVVSVSPSAAFYSQKISSQGPFRNSPGKNDRLFNSLGLKLGLAQELTETLAVDVSAAAYRYSKDPARVNGRYIFANRTQSSGADSLSDTDYPRWQVAGDLKWSFVEDWSISPGASVEKSLTQDATIYGWSADLGRSWTKYFETDISFNSSSGGAASGELSVKYSFGESEKSKSASSAAQKALPGTKTDKE